MSICAPTCYRVFLLTCFFFFFFNYFYFLQLSPGIYSYYGRVISLQAHFVCMFHEFWEASDDGRVVVQIDRVIV